MGTVQTFRGPVRSDELGTTLIHEHVFVRNPELEANFPDPEWDPDEATSQAISGLAELHDLGIRTVVDLTVPGLGRDVALVARVASRAPVHLVAATGWYTPNALPVYFAFHGPGLTIDGPDPLVDLFVRDITLGIAGTQVRAGVIKVMTDADGITPDVERVMCAAAEAQVQTGVPIATHSLASTRNGLEQQAFLVARGVAPDRILIGHCGDTEDLQYLRELMNNGSSIGMDRFGMEHVLPDERRVRTVVALVERGYVDQMVLSHDAAFYSHVTPPSWRATAAPRWRMDTIPRSVVPMLRDAGVSAGEIERMLVNNPRRLLEVKA
jgi:phosphotriesterase-related protein